jgi:hypothetical protein|tara:strand:- start:281 stop:382 length:102 start_codon:yes stop_codon:yes gene_type:complete
VELVVEVEIVHRVKELVEEVQEVIVHQVMVQVH